MPLGQNKMLAVAFALSLVLLALSLIYSAETLPTISLALLLAASPFYLFRTLKARRAVISWSVAFGISFVIIAAILTAIGLSRAGEIAFDFAFLMLVWLVCSYAASFRPVPRSVTVEIALLAVITALFALKLFPVFLNVTSPFIMIVGPERALSLASTLDLESTRNSVTGSGDVLLRILARAGNAVTVRNVGLPIEIVVGFCAFVSYCRFRGSSVLASAISGALFVASSIALTATFTTFQSLWAPVGILALATIRLQRWIVSAALLAMVFAMPALWPVGAVFGLGRDRRFREAAPGLWWFAGVVLGATAGLSERFSLQGGFVFQSAVSFLPLVASWAPLFGVALIYRIVRNSDIIRLISCVVILVVVFAIEASGVVVAADSRVFDSNVAMATITAGLLILADLSARLLDKASLDRAHFVSVLALASIVVVFLAPLPIGTQWLGGGDAYDRLASCKRGPVADLPVAFERSPERYSNMLAAELAGRDDIVFDSTLRSVDSNDPRLLRELRQKHVIYLIVHFDQFNSTRPGDLLAKPPSDPPAGYHVAAASLGSDWLYASNGCI